MPFAFEISINVTAFFNSYLTLYSLILFAVVFIYFVVATFYNNATQRASRSINGQLVDSVLGSTLRSVRLVAQLDRILRLRCLLLQLA